MARLDLAVVVAKRLGHRERLLDLLMQQERDARIQEKSWLRNRITEQAVLQAKGNPLRELEALYRRQRLLLEEPRFESNVWLALDPEANELKLERLQRQEEKQQRLEQRWAYDPFPGSFSLPQVLEDRARLQLAQASDGTWLLPPAVFGELPRRLSAEAYQEESQKLELVFDSLELTVEEREAGPARFVDLAYKSQLRDALEQRLEQTALAQMDSGVSRGEPSGCSWSKRWILRGHCCVNWLDLVARRPVWRACAGCMPKRIGAAAGSAIRNCKPWPPKSHCCRTS